VTDRNCPGCGATLIGGTERCAYCGTNRSAPAPPAAPAHRLHPHAVRAIVYATVGLVFTPVWFWCTGFDVVAIVFGVKALRGIRAEPTVFKGPGVAIVGIILAANSLVIPAIYFAFRGIGLLLNAFNPLIEKLL